MKKFDLKIIADTFEKSALSRIWVRLNQSATLFVLIVAVIAFKLSYDKYNEDRIKTDEDRITKAWDTVTKMAGKQSNGGQVNAIQILAKNSIVLDRIDLKNTYLRGVDLSHTSLKGADLSNADLTDANLQYADLSDAILDGAILNRANLVGTLLVRATLVQTKLSFAKVDMTIANSKNMNNADLTGTYFTFTGENQKNIMDSYMKTYGTFQSFDNAQNKMNNACADIKYEVKQDKSFPFKLPTRPCGGNTNYLQMEFTLLPR